MPKMILDKEGEPIGINCCGTDHIGEEYMLNHMFLWHNPNNLSYDEIKNEMYKK